MKHTTYGSSSLRLFWACALALLAGCAARDSFGTTFPVNQTDDLAKALAQAKAAQYRPLPQVVVGVLEEPRAVFAYDLSAQRLLFKKRIQVTGVPLPAGPFVVVQETNKVTVRHLHNGKSVLELPADGMHLVGADSDGTVTAVALSTGGSMGARSKLVIMQGDHVWGTREIPRQIGGPAVLGGLVFLPHNRVHLSVSDSHANELARIQIREDVASQALTFDNEVYFGLLGMYRVDTETKKGASGGAHYFRLNLQNRLPGQPAFLPNTADPPPALNSAVHRVSLSFLPEMRGETLGLLDNALYLSFYRQIYSLDPTGSQAHWVHQAGSDAVGHRAVPGGVILVEESGRVSSLDQSGTVQWSAEMGVQPVVARVQASSLPRGAMGEPAAPLTTQLVDAALNADARLVPARAMAVSLLAGLEDEDATSALIEICQERSTPERVRQVACAELAKRTNGSAAIASALERHANYLTKTKAPPVGPLAEAAMRTGDIGVVPHLLSHLSDPETPLDELPALMLALKELAPPSAAPQIADFLRLYHADADEARMVETLLIAIDTLRKLQGVDAQGVLEPIANDSLAADAVRAAAAQALAQLAPREDDEGAEAQASAEPEASEAPAPEEVEEGPPEHRNAAHLERALRPVAAKLSECVRSHPKRPSSARLTVVLAGDGDVLAVETLPNELKSCMQPLVLGQPFPANKYGNRETLSTTIPR